MSDSEQSSTDVEELLESTILSNNNSLLDVSTIKDLDIPGTLPEISEASILKEINDMRERGEKRAEFEKYLGGLRKTFFKLERLWMDTRPSTEREGVSRWTRDVRNLFQFQWMCSE